MHHHGVPEDTTPAPAPSTEAETGAEVGAAPEAEPARAEPAPAGLVMPKRLVFRVPGTAYVAVLFFVMCASSVALVSRWFALIYLVPLAMAFWIMRTRTEVDADRIVVRRVLTRTTLPWSKVKSLRLSEKGWVRAVRTDSGAEIALPTVRTRHLPALSLISGGRISDPTAPGDQP